MAGFNDRFGGSTLKPADVSYRALTTSTSQEFQWSQYATDGNYIARTMNIIALVASLNFTLPDAREASPGEQIIFYNSGSFAYTVLSNFGSPIATITPSRS